MEMKEVVVCHSVANHYERAPMFSFQLKEIKARQIYMDILLAYLCCDFSSRQGKIKKGKTIGGECMQRRGSSYYNLLTMDSEKSVCRACLMQERNQGISGNSSQQRTSSAVSGKTFCFV